MSWGKFSDDFSDDCWTLSDAAFRLHVEGIIWSNRKLLDCRVPKDDLRRFAKHPEAVQELLDTGWWTNDLDAYYIRHHASYQPTRAAVLKRQAANATNGRKGGRPRKGTGAPREISELAAQRDEKPDGLANGKPNREPTGRGTGTGQASSYGSTTELGEDDLDDAPREYRGGPASPW